MDATETESLTDQVQRERRGLLAHAYRMLGSWDEAEDAVQETCLRAWRSRETFENRSSVRVWLYRIATNTCLSAIEGRRRRALPSGLGAPSSDPSAPSEVAGPETWIQPIPTSLVADPAAEVVAREGVRLAFIAGLQYLPPQQRAVLLLRDVLKFSAAEAARILETSVPAVKSALQRARGRLNEVSPTREDVREPTERRARELLEQYMAAWERSDPVEFERVLRADATLEGVPSKTWFAGKVACVAFAAPSMGDAGAWRMVPIDANGQPAVAAWVGGEPFGIAVLTMATDGIARITLFADPDLVARFTKPDVAPRGPILTRWTLRSAARSCTGGDRRRGTSSSCRTRSATSWRRSPKP
ncbi:RNA polymerase subunit sigma-70 [Rugosimonospora africana]|uniref:RNA polymerase sigma factor n=1 Tax=Rugosimonospora africana TaxID=556532 RepID=A0A8J3QYG4_9ACTN|nr:RNA polymerase subunit sigma-70 [Rugosimonospora africana]GIH16971.1 RNA polymerase sigma factor [Rugosimonospora africana]